MVNPVRVLVIGCGNMGASHARAYHRNPGFEIVGLVAPSPTRRDRLAAELGRVPAFDTVETALEALEPDAVSINSYPDSHAEYALRALDAGAHVFCEKPIATTVEQARAVVNRARAAGKKVVVGYILRHHPSWVRFVELAQTLGKPLVMRMNLNQQSTGEAWQTHKQLMRSMSPIVDCGVHYVDVMCRMTGSRPIRCSAIGARLTDEIGPAMYNYGQLQVVFEDGSVGWYEAGWGPMISETAYFVKDVIGPGGSVSIVTPEAGSSADIDAHTKTNRLLIHRVDQDGDAVEDTGDEPGHQELCDREQAFLLKAIREDLDLSDHLEDAVRSLQIVLAAHESVLTGLTVRL